MARAGKRRTEGTAAIPTRFSESERIRMERARALLGLKSRSAFIRQAVLDKLEAIEKEGSYNSGTSPFRRP